jgi:hypothetical protein
MNLIIFWVVLIWMLCILWLFHVYSYSSFCMNIEVFRDMTPHRHRFISHYFCEKLQSHYFRIHIIYIRMCTCLCTRIRILWIFNTFLTFFSLCCLANVCCSVYHIKHRRTFPTARLIINVSVYHSNPRESFYWIVSCHCIWFFPAAYDQL